jgi:hypothetical protein
MLFKQEKGIKWSSKDSSYYLKDISKEKNHFEIFFLFYHGRWAANATHL